MSERPYVTSDKFGALLLGLRFGAALSRREVARRAGFSADTARRCEAGDGSVRVDKIIRYGRACGVNLCFQMVKRDAR